MSVNSTYNFCKSLLDWDFLNEFNYNVKWRQLSVTWLKEPRSLHEHLYSILYSLQSEDGCFFNKVNLSGFILLKKITSLILVSFVLLCCLIFMFLKILWPGGLSRVKLYKICSLSLFSILALTYSRFKCFESIPQISIPFLLLYVFPGFCSSFVNQIIVWKNDFFWTSVLLNLIQFLRMFPIYFQQTEIFVKGDVETL